MKKSSGKVSIVISIYKPNRQYFEKLLISINEQDYDNIEVIIRDDYMESDIDLDYLNCYITNFECIYIKGEKNLGVVKSFEKLTMLASGEYVAYCDQDDIWAKDKISKSIEVLEKENGVLVTSDYAIIDENDNIVKENVCKNSKNKFETWKTGDNITKFAVFQCYAVGFSIVVKRDIVTQLVPFSVDVMHDKWITAGASALGKTIRIDNQLAYYRRHGNNVSGTLNGISCKQDYYDRRVNSSYRATMEFLEIFPQVDCAKEVEQFALARKNKNIFKLLKYRRLAAREATFEILLVFCPDFIFRRLLKYI